jgi:class 3 adenylate cyclase
LVFDKRGTGLSERVAPEDHLPLDERINDVTAVMDAVGVERASLLGISEGGPMAVMLAATQPERVERLILCNTFGGDFLTDVDWSLDDVEQFWGTGTVFQTLVPTWSGEVARRLFARYERSGATPSVARGLLEMNGEIDVRPVLSSVQAPTLVMHRRDDAPISWERGRVLAGGSQGAEFGVLPGREHRAYAGAADLLDRVETFLVGSVTPPPTDRVLATMMFVDVVRSTESVQRIGDSAWSRMLDRYESITFRHVSAAHGSVVSTSGDGILCRFGTPARGVLAGLSIVDELRTMGLDARVGLHTGEIEERGDDIAGVNVHVGARVAALAEPGEVWITRTVRDLVAGSGLRFDDRGQHRLEGFEGEVELLAAVAG